MTTTALAEAKHKPKSIRELLEGDNFKIQVARALPKHLTADRFVRVAITAMTRTPKLAECDQATFFNALLTLSQLGIEPDGRRAHLIPFMNRKRNIMECQLIVDYKGLVELVMNTGNCSNIHADVVCENDEFIYDKGEIAAHRIDFRKPRGPWYAAYTIIRFKDGTEKCEVMTREEIEAVRRRSKAADSGPWVTDETEMAKKTVFRRATKWVKLSPEQRDAIEADDNQYPFNDKETVTSTAQMLSERMKAIPAPAAAVEVEQPQSKAETQPEVAENAPDELFPQPEGENKIQGYLDMIRAAQDQKALDTVWAEISEAVAKATTLFSEDDMTSLSDERATKKRELAKGKR